MVNDLLKVVLLAEVHGGLLSEEAAVQMFGEKIVASFRKKYPQVPFEGGYIGNGSRSTAAQRMKEAQRKLKYAEKLFSYLSRVSWIRFAGVTGSISYGNALEDDDIDVFLEVGK